MPFTAQQAGTAVGLAVLATVATSHSNALLGRGTEHVQALRDGYSLAFLCAAGFVFVGWIVAFLVLRGGSPWQPGRTPESVTDEPVASPNGVSVPEHPCSRTTSSGTASTG